MQTKQEGNAILLALLIVTLCTIVATSVIDHQSIQLLRTKAILRQAQMYEYAEGAQLWATHLLETDIYENDALNHTLRQWPKVLSYQTKDGVIITGTLFDAQAFYNINNLRFSKNQYPFFNLFHYLLPDINRIMANDIITATTAWLSSNPQYAQVTTETYYLKQQPAYQTANQLMINASEWRAIKDISPKIFLTVSPYLIALPTITPVNINTASLPVLLTTDDDMTEEAAEKIIAERQSEKGFINTRDFASFAKQNKIPVNFTSVTTSSDFFLLKTEVKYHQHDLLMYNLLQRNKQKDQYTVNILWTSIGTL